MPVRIRPATAADVPALAALFAEAYGAHAAALPRIYRPAADGRAAADFVHGELAREGAAVFVAEADGHVAGYVSVRLADAPNTPVHLPGRWAEVATLAVGTAGRPRGNGSCGAASMDTKRRRPARTWSPRSAPAVAGAWVLWAVLLVAGTSAAAGSAGQVPGGGRPVLVVPITGTIDLGLAPYLDRVLGEAARDGAAAVVLRIDTPGGRLDAVLRMRDALLASGVRTVAFVDRTAFSAGALVALASEDIYMAPGAAMGAATPVDGATGETASEKVVSAVRTTFAATAEARGRDPLVAEAMVDPAVAIDGLVARGELLTLTANEAKTWGYAEGIVDDLPALLAATGLAGAPLVDTSPSLAERVVRFVTDPVVASLLIAAGVLMILADAFVEGFGLLGAAGLGLLALFFWGHALAGLTGWEDVALVVLGLALIAVELFVAPGFGVPGVLGLAALFGGLFLAMLGRDIRAPEGIERAGLTVAASFAIVVLGFAALLVLLPRRRWGGGLVLQTAGGPGDAGTAARPAPRGWMRWFGSGTTTTLAAPARSLVGETGVALSDLRPSGIADIGGRRTDVVADGAFVPAGAAVEVVRDEGYRRVVRRVPG